MAAQGRAARLLARSARIAPLCLVGLLGLLASGCSRGMLVPKSPQASDGEMLFWLMIGIASGVFVVYMGMLSYALFRPRRNVATFERSPKSAMAFVLVGGGLIPLLLLIVVFSFSIRGLAAQQIGSEDHLNINVAGHQWWWEVSYPDAGVTTANEIHIPVGREVVFHLTGDDVIHSFWVPQLAGKTDLIPGQTNELKLKATSAGRYLGQCAEFCGLQHANMHFYVVADNPGDFTAWLKGQQQQAAAPQDAATTRGQQIFLGSACVYCHTIAGTNATGKVGPDLTHLQSRQTIAAGTLENNIGNLAGWITNPQTVKPGNLMPPTQLSSDDLQALLAYLETLK
jgi:cytochrome c oxidase subunit 2